MASSLTGKCDECGQPVDPSPTSHGRRRRYCSDRCRKRAQRGRIRARNLGFGPQAAVERSKVDAAASLALFAGPPEHRAAEILASLYVISAALLKLAPELPPTVSCHLEILGTSLQEKLEELFPIA